MKISFRPSIKRENTLPFLQEKTVFKTSFCGRKDSETVPLSVENWDAYFGIKKPEISPLIKYEKLHKEAVDVLKNTQKLHADKNRENGKVDKVEYYDNFRTIKTISKLNFENKMYKSEKIFEYNKDGSVKRVSNIIFQKFGKSANKKGIREEISYEKGGKAVERSIYALKSQDSSMRGKLEYTEFLNPETGRAVKIKSKDLTYYLSDEKNIERIDKPGFSKKIKRYSDGFEIVSFLQTPSGSNRGSYVYKETKTPFGVEIVETIRDNQSYYARQELHYRENRYLHYEGYDRDGNLRIEVSREPESQELIRLTRYPDNPWGQIFKEEVFKKGDSYVFERYTMHDDNPHGKRIQLHSLKLDNADSFKDGKFARIDIDEYNKKILDGLKEFSNEFAHVLNR